MSRKNVDISKLNLEKIGGRIAYIRLSNGLTMETFGNIVGVTKGNVSNFEKHKYEPSYKVLVELSKHFNVNSDWILTGEGEPYFKDNKLMELFPNEVAELFSNYSDRQRALSINRELIELEKLDSETFIRVESYIRGALDTIRGIRNVTPYNGPERRKGQRRNHDHPDQIPDGQDRRTGEDRRKVSGGTL